MKYIDVTLTLESGMRGVEFTPAKTVGKDGWNAQTLHLYSHCGTHMDAPLHFEVNNDTIDDLPPERFFTLCHVIHLEGIKPKSEIEINDLGQVEKAIKRGEGLIFRTGWSRLVNEPKYRDDLPGISRDLALWCVDNGVAVIGVEPPSVADVNNLDHLTEIHRILLGGGVVIVEGLANLDQITKQKVTLVAMPLKIKNGDGAPCRAVVIEE